MAPHRNCPGYLQLSAAEAGSASAVASINPGPCWSSPGSGANCTASLPFRSSQSQADTGVDQTDSRAWLRLPKRLLIVTVGTLVCGAIGSRSGVLFAFLQDSVRGRPHLLKIQAGGLVSAEEQSPDWVRHPGFNCVNGKGGEVLPDGDYFDEGWDRAACQAACLEDGRCDGILMMPGRIPGPCWLRMDVDPDGCITDTAWDLWHFAGNSRKEARRALNITGKVNKWIQSKATNTSTVSSAITWRHHPGLNCADGMGGEALPDIDLLDGKFGLKECQAVCLQEPRCEGVLILADQLPGPCWLRMQVDPKNCMEGTDWDLWQLERGHKRKTSRASGTSSTTAVEVATTTPSVSTSTETAATSLKGEWVLHHGLNCVNGQGGQQLPNVDIVDDSFTEAQCKAACLKESECEGVLLMPSFQPGPCWLRAHVSADNCIAGTPWDLWVYTGVADVQERRGKRGKSNGVAQAKTAPTSTTSSHKGNRPTAAFPMGGAITKQATWELHKGKNCFAGFGAEKLPSPLDKATQEECRLACEAKPSCEAILVLPNHRSGPCMLRTKVDLKSCLAQREWDLWLRIGVNRTKPCEQGTEQDGPCTTRVDLNAADSDTLPFLSTTDALTTAEPAKPKPSWCPACSPVTPANVSVVIPFYERDLCKMGYTIESLSLHDTKHTFLEVHMMWVSMQPATGYQEDINRMKESLEKTHKVQFHDFSPQASSSGLSGWFAQQVMKLKVASLVSTEYYVVLDSKNTFIRDIEADTFFTQCNQAKIFGAYHINDMPEPHKGWYLKTAGLLNVAPPSDEGYWPASITPVTMHKPTVLKLLSTIGEDPSVDNLCKGVLCDWLQKEATEFVLYLLFASRKTELECSHSFEKDTGVSVALWRGLTFNLDTCQGVQSGKLEPFMFGAQAGALNDMSPEQSAQLTKCLADIYRTAGFTDLKDAPGDEFKSCVIAYS